MALSINGGKQWRLRLSCVKVVSWLRAPFLPREVASSIPRHRTNKDIQKKEKGKKEQGMACSCSSVPPQWRHLLSNALQANQHLKHSKYLQLATVRANGSPANRTIVFRGFVEGTDKLQFTTDSRSQKIHEIKFCPKGEIPVPSILPWHVSFHTFGTERVNEICYYFTDTWEQFRIHGLLEIIGKSETDMNKKLIREKAWFSSSSKSRMQFAGPHPGLPVVASQDDHEPELDSEQGPVDCFCVVTLEPEEVDYVHLTDNKRWVYTRSKKENEEAYSWSEIELTP